MPDPLQEQEHLKALFRRYHFHYHNDQMQGGAGFALCITSGLDGTCEESIIGPVVEEVIEEGLTRIQGERRTT